MSKQDRQGVRTPADIERKYKLGDIELEKAQNNEKWSQLNQQLAQYEVSTNLKVVTLDEAVIELDEVMAQHTQEIAQLDEAVTVLDGVTAQHTQDITGLKEVTAQHTQEISQLDEAVMELDGRIGELSPDVYPIGSVYISVNSTNPTMFFGGTWESVAQGYLLVGLEQENTDAPAQMQYLDKCYLWKRTA